MEKSSLCIENRDRKFRLNLSLFGLILTVAIVSGCGQSPLLNHQRAERLASPNASVLPPSPTPTLATTPPDSAPVNPPSPTAPSAPTPTEPVALTDCPFDFTQLNLCGALTWDLPPPPGSPSHAPGLPDEDGYRSFKFRFFRKGQGNSSTGPFVDPGHQFKVVLFMPSMGHGSSPTRVEPLRDSAGNPAVGQYWVKQVYFSMDGDWDIRLQLKNGNQVVSQVILPIIL